MPNVNELLKRDSQFASLFQTLKDIRTKGYLASFFHDSILKKYVGDSDGLNDWQMRDLIDVLIQESIGLNFDADILLMAFGILEGYEDIPKITKRREKFNMVFMEKKYPDDYLEYNRCETDTEREEVFIRVQYKLPKVEDTLLGQMALFIHTHQEDRAVLEACAEYLDTTQGNAEDILCPEDEGQPESTGMSEAQIREYAKETAAHLAGEKPFDSIKNPESGSKQDIGGWIIARYYVRMARDTERDEERELKNHFYVLKSNGELTGISTVEGTTLNTSTWLDRTWAADMSEHPLSFGDGVYASQTLDWCRVDYDYTENGYTYYGNDPWEVAQQHLPPYCLDDNNHINREFAPNEGLYTRLQQLKDGSLSIDKSFLV